MVSSAATAAPVEVFYLPNGSADEGAVRLNLLPRGKPVLRAILAMYALQQGGGCGGRDNIGFRCGLTTALGLGAQCSKRHVETVRRAFVAGMPILSGWQPERYEKVDVPGELEGTCYMQPDSSSFQETWRSIRLSRDGDIVVVDADGDRMARDDSGEFETHAMYLVRGETVTVVWSQRIMKWSTPTASLSAADD